MTAAAPFLRAALFALDEVGDPTGDRQIIVDAIEKARPLVSFHKPGTAKKVVGWAATQMAMSAEDPGRAYSWLRELLRALLAPMLPVRGHAPAPEVAMAMPSGELIESLAPSPRVIARDIATGMDLDIRSLLVDDSPAKRVLGVRAIPQALIGRYAAELATTFITAIPREVTAATARRAVELLALSKEVIAICQPATDKVRAKVAQALQPFVRSADSEVRANVIGAIHLLRYQLDDDSLLGALRDSDGGVRAAALRTIGTGRRDYAAAVVERLVELVSDEDSYVRISALGALTRFPSLLTPALLEPLRACAAHGDEEGKTAVFLLGRLGAQPNTAVIDLSAIDTTDIPDRQQIRAYTVAPVKGGLAVSDRGTGKQLFVVERVGLLEFIPRRAEVATIREERRRAWQFERFRIPDGVRLGSIAIPQQLTHGTPKQIAIAADLVTVWCDHADAPYRFHIKLGDPDVVLDDAPVLGRAPK